MSNSGTSDGGQALEAALKRARAYSPFLREASYRHPDLVTTLLARGADAAWAEVEVLPQFTTIEAMMRHERSAVSLILAITDLAGFDDFADVTARLTSFADRMLDLAIRQALNERTGAAEPTGFVATALGKQGGGELNYSSDIDPIFLYDPETLPRRGREDAGQAAVRTARRVVELLQTRTGDGYVLRVDLRLRPSPEVSPIAVPVDAAIAYYETSALTWERAAFIRARSCAGDIALGCRFVDAIQPFVWRRSLDFGAIAEITDISRRIRDEYPDRQAFGPGYDLKRGRGGIREIEFYTQIHQLIHGGRDPTLRERGTLPALAALAEAGWIDHGTADRLGQAYRLLRTIEHRLQMIDDQQTHSLPNTRDALDAVAGLHGLADGEALLALLAPHVAWVRTLYDALAGTTRTQAGLSDDPDVLAASLGETGFADPEAVARQIAGWRGGVARSLRTPAARTAFEAMLPKLIEAIARTADPMGALYRFGDILRGLPSGINLYRLLDARPALVGLLAQILGHAPALADQLARSPERLDGLIDASSLDPPPDLATLVEQIGRGTAEEGYEVALDTVRRRVNDWRFALGVQLITGHADPLAAAAGYARVAEASIVVLAEIAVRAFASVHGSVPGSEFVIVGLGRIGGAAMTHASDLDLVYLFTGGIDASSDGARPLRATDYFNRLARRMTAALSLPTAAGALYDVDTRLRPSGIHGMLAVSLDAFAEYQRSAAWTFEHMALTRGRGLTGSPHACALVDAAIRTVLVQPRDAEACIRDAASMRKEIARHKPAASAFDVKMCEGGLVDLEFSVQLTQLTRGVGFDANLSHAVATQMAAGLQPPDLASAHDLLTRLLVILRLVAPGGRDPDPASRPLIAGACGFEDWDALCQALTEARRVVADAWRNTARGSIEC